MNAVVSFTVYGAPQPQAGTKSVPAGRTREGKQLYRKISEGGKDLLPWRQEVAARAADERAKLDAPLRGAVLLDVAFRFHMPASRPKRLRPWAWKETKPDTDKLLRAIGDSCKSAGLVADDAAFAVTIGRKVEVWDSWEGATITLTPLGPRAVVRVVVEGDALDTPTAPADAQGRLL